MPRLTPRNRLSRAERLRRLNDAAAEARQHQPVQITGQRNARFDWLRYVSGSTAAPLTRLVAHCLAMHGQHDGTNVFPSVRTLAKDSGLSPRSVSTHLDRLVRAGYLWRQERKRDTLWACGFAYLLCVPRGLYAGQGRPVWERSAERASAPGLLAGAEGGSTPGVERASTPGRGNGAARGVEAGADVLKPAQGGVERDDSEVLNGVQRSLKSESVRESVTQCRRTPTRTRSARANGPEDRKETEKAILELLRQHTPPGDIVKVLRARGVTLADIERIRQEAGL